jgi:hypothetical protein
VFGLLILGGPIAAAGYLVFFLPYRLIDWIATRPGIPVERQSTWKLLGGTAVYLLWILLWSLVALIGAGPFWAIVTAAGLPVLAIATQIVRDRWRRSMVQARRFLVLRRSGGLRERLLAQRAHLGRTLESLRRSAQPES